MFVDVELRLFWLFLVLSHMYWFELDILAIDFDWFVEKVSMEAVRFKSGFGLE